DGSAHHMTADPLPNTPTHRVLMHAAFGDYQVPNIAAEVAARTVGATLFTKSVPARHWAKNPAFGFNEVFDETATSGVELDGSALVYWDSGNPAPPNGNVPPEDRGADPHSHPRMDVAAAQQKTRFYRSGKIPNVHDSGSYCT